MCTHVQRSGRNECDIPPPPPLPVPPSCTTPRQHAGGSPIAVFAQFHRLLPFPSQDIFAQLDPVGLVRIAAVCTRWRKLCRGQPALFRRVVLGRSSHQDRVTVRVLEWFVGDGTDLRVLNLENCKHTHIPDICLSSCNCLLVLFPHGPDDACGWSSPAFFPGSQPTRPSPPPGSLRFPASVLSSDPRPRSNPVWSQARISQEAARK